ncbi:hypothetical protein BJ912DRAFT_985245 [Pholiota molesta]|nr:hypothetical protein BJ912DRAFT_985245 [Pholiota molesta]
MHRIFTVRGVPRESVIVSIPATEAGILAAQLLQKQGMIISLHFVTTLVHAQACVEAGVSAIFVSVGPLLDVYERRRNTVYHNLTEHPGIETLQSILAYFKVNGIKTKVIGADFRNLAEIGLLSECDAVCVSAEHANELSWTVLRARQAKYPTDLLTRKGGFSTWFSPESRSLTSQLLHDALNTMQNQMKLIEHVVEEEMIRRIAFQIPLRNLPQVGSPFKPKGIQSKSDKPSDDGQPSLQWDFRLEERCEMDESSNIAPAS